MKNHFEKQLNDSTKLPQDEDRKDFYGDCFEKGDQRLVFLLLDNDKNEMSVESLRDSNLHRLDNDFDFIEMNGGMPMLKEKEKQ